MCQVGISDKQGRIEVLRFILFFYRVSRDLLAGLLLLVFGLLVGPLVYLRGSTMPEYCWRCLRVLLARGLFARFVRAAVEWRLGNFSCAVLQLESVVTALEKTMTVQLRQTVQGKVLSDLYTLLARMYLYGGHIDAALLLIMRVHKVLGIDRLPGLPELDAKTAHLVRASIAAGRLLDGNGLATLVVKTAVFDPNVGKSKQTPADKRTAPRGKAKVIPFPSCSPR